MTVRKFRVTVDGQSYDVEIEEIGLAAGRPVRAGDRPTPPGGPAVPPAVPGPAAPARKAAVAKAPAIILPPGADGITAPLPGVILDVRVSPGQAVKAGQVLFILEAMKMENEITAPRAGEVLRVEVGKGVSVGVGQLLAVLKG
ncbi:MAG TPA: biotin/lipoyl-containing protein [Bacillota bacterium]|jgi:glutaconyl-CoA decarboxylase